jgi:hypothetical protein
LGSGVVHPGTGAPDSTGCSLSRKALARPRNAAPWPSIAIGAAALVIASRRRRAARRG